MTKIEGNTITITRGDTLIVGIDILKNGEPYELKDSDVVRFAVKHRYSDKQCLIKQIIPSKTKTIRIEATEMKKLPCLSDGYVFDVELKDEGGVVDTFISGKLIIIDEVD